MSFVTKWKEEIWPVVEKKYNDLIQQRPAKQETATGTHYGDKVFEILATKKELRNIACNLTWTNPVENTNLQCNISMSTVERFALDMYIDTTQGQVADTAVAGSAAGVAGERGGRARGCSMLPRFSSSHRIRHGRFPHESPGVMRSRSLSSPLRQNHPKANFVAWGLMLSLMPPGWR